LDDVNIKQNYLFTLILSGDFIIRCRFSYQSRTDQGIKPACSILRSASGRGKAAHNTHYACIKNGLIFFGEIKPPPKAAHWFAAEVLATQRCCPKLKSRYHTITS
jgi:hypothetical protein